VNRTPSRWTGLSQAVASQRSRARLTGHCVRTYGPQRDRP
jgi:hypothetical protein